MGHYSTFEEDEENHRAHEAYDHENPPKNSRVPGMVEHMNLLFEALKLEWNPEKKTFVNKLGDEYSAALMNELCGIMGLDPFEEMPRVMLEEAFKKV